MGLTCQDVHHQCACAREVKAFEINETSKRVKIIVSEDQLSLAIGKRGPNARLTSN